MPFRYQPIGALAKLDPARAKAQLQAAITHAGGRIAEAARGLGISERECYRLMRVLGIALPTSAEITPPRGRLA